MEVVMAGRVVRLLRFHSGPVPAVGHHCQPGWVGLLRRTGSGGRRICGRSAGVPL